MFIRPWTRPIMKLSVRSRILEFNMVFTRGASSSNIKITKILREDHKSLSDFLLKHFYHHEPMGVVLGLNVKKEVENWFPKYVKKHLSLSPQISSQAIDSSGKLIGVSFAVIVDPKKPRPPLMVDYVDPDTQKTKAQISRFLDEIEEGIDACELLGLTSLSSTDSPMSIDNLMLSIDKDYWQQGISHKLIKKSEEFALKYKDCRAGQVVVTSEFSYKAYLKCGYQVIREFQYAKYHDAEKVQIFQGKEAQLGIHKSARVMIKLIE